MTRLEQAALRHMCPRCRAGVARPCLDLRFSKVRLHVARPHKERTALAFPVWRKGDKPADAGSPLRHPRAKVLLLLEDASPEILRGALLALADRDPVPVLAALCDVIDVREALACKRKEKAGE